MNSNLMMMTGGSDNGNGGNFDWNQIANIVGATSMNVNNLSNQMGLVVATVNDMNEKMISIDERLNKVEYNEEITTDQVEELKRAVHRRCYEILGNDQYEIEKYFDGFVRRLWSDLKKNVGVAHKYEKTKKGNYQRAIDYIEAWIPNGGCYKLKCYLDDKAKARKKAKTNGYKK